MHWLISIKKIEFFQSGSSAAVLLKGESGSSVSSTLCVSFSTNAISSFGILQDFNKYGSLTFRS